MTADTPAPILYAASDAAQYLSQRCGLDITGTAISSTGFRIEAMRGDRRMVIVADIIYPEDRPALRVSRGVGRRSVMTRTATLRTVDGYSSAAVSALEGLRQSGALS